MIDIYKDAWHVVILDYTPNCIQSEHLSSNPPHWWGERRRNESSPQGLSQGAPSTGPLSCEPPTLCIELIWPFFGGKLWIHN